MPKLAPKKTPSITHYTKLMSALLYKNALMVIKLPCKFKRKQTHSKYGKL
jgi:hypothetical protein